MKKALKIIGIAALVLVGVIGLAAIVLNVMGGSQLNRSYDVPTETITIPTDEVALARGEHLAQAICSECHGENLQGQVLVDEPGMFTVYAPNITPSEQGVGHFSDADYVRAIRHAVNPDGHGYVIMPAEIFIHWSAEDLGATIAYLKSLPPSDNDTPPKDIGLMGMAMLGAGVMGDIIPASYIDHDRPLTAQATVSDTQAYGAYFVEAFGCTLCHGEDMRGGPPPAGQEDLGEIPDALASASAWSAEEFVTAVTTGVTPDGRQLDPEKMPVSLYDSFSAEELTALHEYLVQQAAQ